MNITDLQNSSVVILGYGKEGHATEAFIKKYAPDARITIRDQRDGDSYLKGLDSFDVVIKTPGIPSQFVNVPYTTATNIFFAYTKGTTIGITGSKGKSTTAALLADMLSVHGYRTKLAGNIGTPMLATYDPTHDSETYYVCELSSYQLADIDASPHVSVILNLFPEHMDYHGDENSYYQAKLRIVSKATRKDFLVYCPDYPQLVAIAEKTQAQAVPITEDLPVHDSEIPLLGSHNRDNVCAAATAAALLGVSKNAIASAIRSFRPLPHRLTHVGTFRGIEFYDDAIATTPQATIQAIRSIPRVATILLGGKDRGYDFTMLGQEIAKSSVSAIIFFPDSGNAIHEAIMKATGRSYTVLHTDSMQKAVEFAYDTTPKGYVCLLSTASPSYSLWKNFEEKGDLYQEYIRTYGTVKTL